MKTKQRLVLSVNDFKCVIVLNRCPAVPRYILPVRPAQILVSNADKIVLDIIYKIVKYSKEEGKDQESMQSSTTPDLGDHIQESQEVSPFPAGDSKAARNRQDSMTQTKTNSKHKITKKDPQKKHNMNKSLSHKVANEFIIKKG